MLVSGILLAHRLALSSPAVRFNKDGVAEGELAVAAAVGLQGANVGTGYVTFTVVRGDIISFTFRDAAAGLVMHH